MCVHVWGGMCGSPKAFLFYFRRQLVEQTCFPFVSCVFVCDIECFTAACGLFLTGSSKEKKKQKKKQQKDPTERMRLCDNAWSVHGPLMRALVFMLCWRVGGDRHG